MADNSFAEERIADGDIVRDSAGGPMFNTQVTRSASGAEQRNANWDTALGRWDLGQRNLLAPQLDVLLAFFRAREGKAVGFRFKDWSDCAATTTQGTLVAVSGVANAYQLYKTYTTTSGATNVRKITKPVSGTVKIFAAGHLTTPLAASIDCTTGIVTLAAPPVGQIVWSGEFDVPVRFDTDELKTSFIAYDPATKQKMFQVFALPVTELLL